MLDGKAMPDQRLTVKKKKEIIDLISDGEDENKVAKKYRITRQAAKYIWNNKDTFLQKIADGISLKRKTIKESPFSPMEDNLNLLIRDLSDDGYPINENYIILMAKEIANEMNIDGFSASKGWCWRFKKRYNLTCKKLCGEAISVDDEVCTNWILDKQNMLDLFKPEDIYNLDETGLFWKQICKNTINFKGVKCHGTKEFKERITILFTVSMSGEKCKPLVIGKFAKPRCLKDIKYKTDLFDLDYKSQKNAWMNQEIFQSYIIDWNEKLSTQNRFILLIMDNVSFHNVDEPSNIQFLYLPPNTTAKLQPLDNGIISSFKTNYKSKLFNLVIESSRVDKTPDVFLKKFDLKGACKLVQHSWYLVQNQSIVNSWNGCNIKSNKN